jgi:hypothetical protein
MHKSTGISEEIVQLLLKYITNICSKQAPMFSSSGAMFGKLFSLVSIEIELIAVKLQLDSCTSLVGQVRHNNFICKLHVFQWRLNVLF